VSKNYSCVQPSVRHTRQSQRGDDGATQFPLRQDPADVSHRASERIAARQQKSEDEFLDEIRSRGREEILDQSKNGGGFVSGLQVPGSFV
jgi:hypothetical protein